MLSKVYPNYAFLLGGEFNCRVSLFNQVSEEVLYGSHFASSRLSVDKVYISIGKNLVHILETQGFLLINGRSRSDFFGDFTLVDSAGKSVIELVWISWNGLNLFKDFKVLSMLTNSDQSEEFYYSMESTFNTSSLLQNREDLDKILYTSIYSTASSLNTVRLD